MVNLSPSPLPNTTGRGYPHPHPPPTNGKRGMWRMWGSAAIASLAGDLVFVEALVEVQALKDELDGGGDGGGIAVAVELGNRSLEAADASELVDVFHRGLRIRRRDAQPLVEAGHELVELGHLEVVAEDLDDG